MKQKEYMDKIKKRIENNSPAKCEDCGEITKIAHAIIDHQNNNVKVVCDNCFKNKYMNFLYPDGGNNEKS